MEEIVKRLSEIETEAVRIIDDSAVQKKEMDAESEKRLRKYDEESNAKTAAELAKLRTSLENRMAEELKKLRQETERMIQSIEADYAANHGMLASQVLHKMIEG